MCYHSSQIIYNSQAQKDVIISPNVRYFAIHAIGYRY